MADKRIIELEESTTIAAGDYFAIDSNAGGTCKANAGIITNQFADMQNYMGAKNLLLNSASSSVASGITWTVNSDKTVTANGTATDTYSIKILGTVHLKAGEKYILSGCPSGGSYASFSLYNEGSAYIAQNIDFGNGATLEPISDADVTIAAIVYAPYTANNVLFKPMVRLASIVDDTYEIFTKTNAQLTTELGNPSSASNVSGSDAFSKINSLNNDQTWEDITNQCTWNSGATYDDKIVLMKKGLVYIHMNVSSLNLATTAMLVRLPTGITPLSRIDYYNRGLSGSGSPNGTDFNVIFRSNTREARIYFDSTFAGYALISLMIPVNN